MLVMDNVQSHYENKVVKWLNSYSWETPGQNVP